MRGTDAPHLSARCLVWCSGRVGGWGRVPGLYPTDVAPWGQRSLALWVWSSRGVLRGTCSIVGSNQIKCHSLSKGILFSGR